MNLAWTCGRRRIERLGPGSFLDGRNHADPRAPRPDPKKTAFSVRDDLVLTRAEGTAQDGASQLECLVNAFTFEFLAGHCQPALSTTARVSIV